MKPILFNTEMVKAIIDDLKTVTRRVVKPQPKGQLVPMPVESCWRGYFGEAYSLRAVRPPYHHGDILYVRETWQFLPCIDCPEQFSRCDRQPIEYEDSNMVAEGCYIYKADCLDPSRVYWHPSIHMPREAARIFLRATGVWVQQVRDITAEEAQSEGFADRAEFISAFLKMYPDCTEESWVWVIEFERITKEEAYAHNS